MLIAQSARLPKGAPVFPVQLRCWGEVREHTWNHHANASVRWGGKWTSVTELPTFTTLGYNTASARSWASTWARYTWSGSFYIVYCHSDTPFLPWTALLVLVLCADGGLSGRCSQLVQHAAAAELLLPFPGNFKFNSCWKFSCWELVGAVVLWYTHVTVKHTDGLNEKYVAFRWCSI